MNLDHEKIKNWTTILVSWFSLLGLVSAGAWTVLEYLERREKASVATVFERLQQFESGDLREAFFRIERAWIGNYEQIREAKQRDANSSSNSSHLLSSRILDLVESEKLAFDLRRVMYFFERLAVCVDAGICDRVVTYRLLGEQALSIRNNYYPYLVFIRNKTEDEQYFCDFNTFALDYREWKSGRSSDNGSGRSATSAWAGCD